MIRLLRAEWTKIITTRIGYLLVLLAIADTAVSTAAQVFLANFPGAPGLHSAQAVRGVFASASAGLVFALVLGILGMTAEYRHQTITPTLLLTPRRGRLVVAKLLSAIGLGLALGLAGAGTALGTGLVALTLRSHAAIPTHQVVTTLLGAIGAFVCYAVIGTAIGTLIRNQVAAITFTLLWVMLTEPLLVAFLPKIGRWLPGGAASGLAQASKLTGGTYLPPALAASVLVGYTLTLAAVASRTTMRRDIT